MCEASRWKVRYFNRQTTQVGSQGESKMKHILLALTVLLMGCVSTSTTGKTYDTLDIQNRSGASVRIFADDGGVYSLSRAYPGRQCVRLRRSTPVQGIRFGIQHQSRDVVWMQGAFQSTQRQGYYLSINQPNQDYNDVQAIVPSELC